jgi:hypothetical protein
MDLEEQSGVDPVIERTCQECGAQLTEQEIKAALESESAFLCSVHAMEQVPIEDLEEGQAP